MSSNNSITIFDKSARPVTSETTDRVKQWHVVCDEFSWFGWSYESAVKIEGPQFDKENWERTIASPPDTSLLLVESAWEGFEGFDRLAEMQRIIKAFRSVGIPVVFWNKEDPAEFDTFLQVALGCDAILSTDRDMLKRYRSCGFSGPIELLTFAVQPQVHREYSEKVPGKIAFFAGAPWFQHPDRLAAYHYFLKPVLELGCVDIFARKSYLINRSHWPEEAQQYIVGELPYQNLLETASQYLLGLSMSCCPESSTMYPRRIVELPMAGVLPISDNSRAVREMFPEIPVASYARESRNFVDFFATHEAERVDRLTALQERILSNHTYRQALSLIQSLVGVRGGMSLTS